MAVSTHQQPFLTIFLYGNLQAFAISAAGGRLARLRFFYFCCESSIKVPGLMRINFESAPAVRTNMVETTLRFARVNNVAATALWTADDVP